MNILASMERSSQLRLNDSIIFLTHLALIKNVKFFESIYFLTAKGIFQKSLAFIIYDYYYLLTNAPI